jgi:hypothetical protein
MLRRFTQKRWIAALSVVAVLAVAGGAIAYFTASGSGTGSATVGTPQKFTVAVTGPTGLLPGAAAQGIGIKVTNPGTSAQELSAVTVSVDPAWTGAQADTTKPPCTAADFALTPPTVTAGEVAPGATATVSGAQIAMNDLGTNQDNCQGVNVPLVVNAS